MTDDPIPEDLAAVADQVKAWADHTERAMDAPGDQALVAGRPPEDLRGSPASALDPRPVGPDPVGPDLAGPAGAGTATVAGRRRRAAAIVAVTSIAAAVVLVATFGGSDRAPADREVRVASEPSATTAHSVERPATSASGASVTSTSGADGPVDPVVTTSAAEDAPGTTAAPGYPHHTTADTEPLPIQPGVTTPPAPPGPKVTTTTEQEEPAGGPVAGELLLPTTTVASGGTIQGTLRVTNANGRPLAYIWCGTAFASKLANDEVEQEVVLPACAMAGTLATGVTEFPITIRADHGSCSTSPSPTSTSPPCGPGPSIPGLPAGSYRLTIIAPTGLTLSVTPPSITVTG